ncbi:hypothetical protein SG34_009320 [Thalassomonas viridans]|uniref:Uncharacterized protein n=1 Tax=Thalassomonas viridans TaxID=137584 RepID=A0AAF0CBC1_9GAMM|nr:hypothetical protein [Thalassomonas viridans]WDE07065.1 hypothetical protein SG34_009320 [Thalassomonas viridans]
MNPKNRFSLEKKCPTEVFSKSKNQQTKPKYSLTFQQFKNHPFSFAMHLSIRTFQVQKLTKHPDVNIRPDILSQGTGQTSKQN